jgi:hypothetical protein
MIGSKKYMRRSMSENIKMVQYFQYADSSFILQDRILTKSHITHPPLTSTQKTTTTRQKEKRKI